MCLAGHRSPFSAADAAVRVAMSDAMLQAALADGMLAPSMALETSFPTATKSPPASMDASAASRTFRTSP